MTIDFYWRLPTHGCHNSIQTSGYERGDWSRSPPATSPQD